MRQTRNWSSLVKEGNSYSDRREHSRKCLRALPDLFSPNLIDQSSCKLNLVSACVGRILHDDWSIRLGENRRGRVLKHLTAMLFLESINQLGGLNAHNPYTRVQYKLD